MNYYSTKYVHVKCEGNNLNYYNSLRIFKISNLNKELHDAILSIINCWLLNMHHILKTAYTVVIS